MPENEVHESDLFPVVGVGASAGGLTAFQSFFAGIARDEPPGFAVVLVQHLDPRRKSMLADIVKGFTDLEVSEVADGMVLKVNRVYVIPSGYELTLSGGVLHLAAIPEPRGIRHPVDAFLRSLAAERGSLAAAVILSGTGTDGSAGIQAIHRQGGLVLVQDGASADFDGMPESAIATGEVDIVAPPARMPGEIRARFFPSADGISDRIERPWNDEGLARVFALLQARTSRDFSRYKPNTVRRRIERRMAVRKVATLEAYISLLEGDSAEVAALFDDLLIGVTCFFRDPEVFGLLADKAIPSLLARPGERIRAWSAGCSTGEEAYSLAILLREAIDTSGQDRDVHVFASDIDPAAIEAARAGSFPPSVAGDVSPERLERFFSQNQDQSSFRIRKSIRDMVIFSVHDIIKDPPFFKLDLLVCRNLLIYLNLDLQKKILPMFHYALNPGGILVLGTSETIGEFGHLFEPLDKTCKVFVRREVRSTYPRSGGSASSPLRFFERVQPERQEESAAAAGQPGVSLKALAEQGILRLQDMAAALVNEHGDVLYLHGKTGYFLEPPEGESGSLNILRMAKDGLRQALAAILHQAVAGNAAVVRRGIQVTWRDRTALVALGVHPLEGMYLVLMEESPVNEGGATFSPDLSPHDDERCKALARELETKDEYLRNIMEEMETSNEELRSSNEELQSVNEELQSSNEELETSKEELQSVNEELSTVNAELNSKVADLTTTNNDMNNLLAATGVATVFVDLKLNILRYTPEATRVINLIPGDLGRPVGHLASTLVDYDSLQKDSQNVLDTLIPFEREVRSDRQSWYRLRIQPYRTIDNVIEGAVISFIDITQIVTQRAELESRNSQLRLVAVVQDSANPVIVQDLSGAILAWNPAAVEYYGWTEAEALAMNALDFVPEALRPETAERNRLLAVRGPVGTCRCSRLTKDGRLLSVWATSTPLVGKDKKAYAISTVERPEEGDPPASAPGGSR